MVDLRQYVASQAGVKTYGLLEFTMQLRFNGNPPYLDLPSTGWDTYSNTGRGFIQGRYRRKNMVYLEAEYRFKVSKSGLLGGVVFANAQSLTEWHQYL